MQQLVSAEHQFHIEIYIVHEVDDDMLVVHVTKTIHRILYGTITCERIMAVPKVI
jgi:hypothetical protein